MTHLSHYLRKLLKFDEPYAKFRFIETITAGLVVGLGPALAMAAEGGLLWPV